MAKRSDEFHVGQMVVFSKDKLDAHFVWFQKLVKDRIGIIRHVFPATNPNPETYAGLVNKVRVEWQKRNGRGKVFSEMTRPDVIEPATEEQIKAWYKPEAGEKNGN